MARVAPFVVALLSHALLFATTRSFAQATIFEVPSGEPPRPADFFFQQQLELGTDLDSTTNATFGLPYGIDVGLSLHHLSFERERGKIAYAPNYDDRQRAFAPLVLVGIEKLTKIAGPIAIDVGLQAGPNVADPSNVRGAMRAYANAVLELGEQSRCVAGGYVGNYILLGRTTVAAPWTGCDLELVESLFGVEADWDFGAHQQAGATVGPKLFFGKHVDLAAGVRIPNPWASGSYAGVMQLELKDVLGN